MRVSVLYFARSREIAGAAEEQLDLPDGSDTLQLLAALRGRHPGLADVFR